MAKCRRESDENPKVVEGRTGANIAKEDATRNRVRFSKYRKSKQPQ